MLKKRISTIINTGLFFLLSLPYAWADDPLTTSTEFSDKMLAIVKGPASKLLGAVILLIGIASLLRGSYKVAVACFVAFLLILFLPGLIAHINPGN